jgi:hypothetical protein
MDLCQVEGCKLKVSKSGYLFCLDHWKADRAGKLSQCPACKTVYIEFWGRQSDPKYAARMSAKKALYTKHNLHLIELADAEIERLDDVLPRMLLKFGIESA